MPTFRFGEDVVLHTRTRSGVDGDGNDVFTDSTQSFSGVPVWPADGNGNSSNERVQGQDLVVSGYAALLPADTDVQSIDVVEVYGQTFEVVGLPGRFHSPFTDTNPGVVLNLRRVTG